MLPTAEMAQPLETSMFSHLAEGPSQTHTTQDHCTVATGKEQETILCENQDDCLLLYFRVITH